MFRGKILTFAFATLAGISTVAVAQVPPGQPNITPEQQAMMDEMRSVRQQVIENMVAKGINPGDFFREMMQNSPDGQIDMQAMQQALVDKGLLDADTAAHVQNTVQKFASTNLRQQFEMSDAEWNEIQPKIQQVVDSAFDAGYLRGGMMMALPRTQKKGPNDMAKAMAELRVVLKNPDSTKEQIAEKLQAWRDAHQRAIDQFNTAEKELVPLLTQKQEAVLMNLGVLR